MNQYITGSFIKKLREEKGLTQNQLAEKLFVSDKAVSKWETGKGYPDISLIEDLANVLGISVIELLSGNDIQNNNRSANLRNVKFYVCPICGNIIFSFGEAVVSCCGISLIPLEAEEPDNAHKLSIQKIEDELYISSSHEMSKMHFISFIAVVKDTSCEIIKLYPESNCEVRINPRCVKQIYFYCNHHGLFKQNIK